MPANSILLYSCSLENSFADSVLVKRQSIFSNKTDKFINSLQHAEDKFHFKEEEKWEDGPEVDGQDVVEEDLDVVEDTHQEFIVDQRCECEACTAFHKKYVHEMDVFSGLIWLLKMHKEENGAEFKAIYVYGAATFEDGLWEGTAIC